MIPFFASHSNKRFVQGLQLVSFIMFSQLLLVESIWMGYPSICLIGYLIARNYLKSRIVSSFSHLNCFSSTTRWLFARVVRCIFDKSILRPVDLGLCSITALLLVEPIRIRTKPHNDLKYNDNSGFTLNNSLCWTQLYVEPSK